MDGNKTEILLHEMEPEDIYGTRNKMCKGMRQVKPERGGGGVQYSLHKHVTTCHRPHNRRKNKYGCHGIVPPVEAKRMRRPIHQPTTWHYCSACNAVHSKSYATFVERQETGGRLSGDAWRIASYPCIASMHRIAAAKGWTVVSVEKTNRLAKPSLPVE